MPPLALYESAGLCRSAAKVPVRVLVPVRVGQLAYVPAGPSSVLNRMSASSKATFIIFETPISSMVIP